MSSVKKTILHYFSSVSWHLSDWNVIIGLSDVAKNLENLSLFLIWQQKKIFCKTINFFEDILLHKAILWQYS